MYTLIDDFVYRQWSYGLTPRVNSIYPDRFMSFVVSFDHLGAPVSSVVKCLWKVFV